MSIKVGGEEGVTGTTAGLRGVWEATSFQLERLQCDPACVEQEASVQTKKNDTGRDLYIKSLEVSDETCLERFSFGAVKHFLCKAA